MDGAMDASLTLLEVVQKSILIKIALVSEIKVATPGLVFILQFFVELKESQVRLHIHMTLSHGWSHGCDLPCPGACPKIAFKRICKISGI